jgi:peptidyl-prolyl cis-trans isomerase SurA
MVDKWVKQKLPGIFISIDNRYADCSFDPDLKKSVLTK